MGEATELVSAFGQASSGCALSRAISPPRPLPRPRPAAVVLAIRRIELLPHRVCPRACPALSPPELRSIADAGCRCDAQKRASTSIRGSGQRPSLTDGRGPVGEGWWARACGREPAGESARGRRCGRCRLPCMSRLYAGGRGPVLSGLGRRALEVWLQRARLRL